MWDSSSSAGEPNGESPGLPEPNSALAKLAGILVRGFERLSIRGAPTLLLALSRVPVFSRSVATVELGPHRMTFPAFDAYWCRYLWAQVPFEPDVAQIFRKLGKGAVLIDCGANIGYWSVRASEFGFVKVIAVEANRDLIGILRRNFISNGVPGEVLHAAIYSASGEHLFLDRTAAHAQGALGERGMPVTSITLADIVAKQAPQDEVVAKLDVEGAEVAAIDGASGIDRITFVYEDFPQQGMRVTSELLRREYRVFGVAPSGQWRAVGNVDDAIAFNRGFALPGWPSNLVACRSERAQLVERKLSADQSSPAGLTT